MKKKLLSIVLALAMVLSMVPSAFAEEAIATPTYVSIGASNTNGYGIRGYLLDEVTEDPLAASKAALNVYGYGRAPKAAYPAQVAEELGADLEQLAISSMRVEELRYLLDETYSGDAYMEWRFTGGQRWFEIAEPAGGVSALREAYQTALAKADVISLDIGWNNFGVYAFNNIKTILADGCYWKAPDFSQVMDLNEEVEYEAIKAYAKELLATHAGVVDGDLQNKLELMADVLTYATIGACYHFDIVMEKIYDLNDDAKVVVVNIQNLAEGLSVEFEGVDLPLGDIYGELIDMVNVYRAVSSPYSDKFFVANPGEDGYVTTFLDEILEWDGNPEALSPNMKDCFDMYDDNLYVRSIIEYMMVAPVLLGQPLPKLVADMVDSGNIDMDKILEAMDSSSDNFNEELETFLLQASQALASFRKGENLDPLTEAVYKAYKDTLNYAYGTVATVVQKAAEIDTVEVETDSLKGFNGAAKAFMGYVFREVLAGAEINFKYALGEENAPYTFVMDEDLFADPAIAAIAVLTTRYELGNSFFAHPNEEGHDQITEAILGALDREYTGDDFTEDNVTEAIDTAIYLISEYYDEAYAYAYDYAFEAGYIDAAVDAIDGVIEAVEAIEVPGTEAFQAEVKVEIEKIVETLEAAQDVLTEADELEQASLDALMTMLNEAADAVLHLEHLLAQSADDTWTLAVKPAIEAAYKELTEVVIPQIDKQLQIAVKAGAEWLEAKLSEAADALIEAVIEALPGVDQALYDWLYENPDKVIAFFTEYGDDIAALMEEYGEDALRILAYIAFTCGEEAVDYIVNNPEEALDQLVGWYDEYGYRVWPMVDVYLAELGVYDNIKDAAGQLNAKVLEKLSGIKDMIDDQLEAIENLKAELEGMKAELENKLENLKAELESKLEELENASEEVKAEIEKTIAEIEAAIDAVEKAIAEIDAKIAELVQFVRDVNSAVENLIAAVELFAENATGAVKAVATALKDLTDAISAMQEFAADLSAAIDSLQDIMNEVPLALEELSKLAAEVAAAFDAVIEACKSALFDATHGEYDVNCQSYYVSLGDSTVTGYGADFGANPDGYGEHGFKTLVPDSFPYMLAEKLGLDLETAETTEMQYIQLAMAGLRTNDLLYILDETQTPDDYFYKRSLPQYVNVYGGGLDAMREDYKSELAKADLVTIAIGNCNFTGVQETGIIAKWINNDESLNAWMNNPYFGDAIKSAIIDLGIDLNAPAYATDWDSYLSEDEQAEMYEVIEEIKEAMVENGLPKELSIDVGEMLEMPLEPGTIVVTVPVADLMGQFIEWYAYCYVSHAFNYNDLLNKIHEMTRPDAEIVIVGMFNPMDDLVITYEGKEIPVGEYVDYALSAVNLTSFSYALLHPNTTYVSVPDVESVADYDMAQNGNVFELMEFVTKYTAEVHGNFTDHHETVAGHAYIADRIYDALTVTNTAHIWNDGVVTKAANCTETGEKLYTCDACGETKPEAIDIDPTAHAWGAWTKVDANDHKRVCGNNANHVDVTSHAFGGDNICDDCNYDKTPVVPGPGGGGAGGGGATKPVNPFIDVDEDDYWYDAVLWAVEKGITNGITSTTFAPTEVCTRGQMVTFLWRSVGSPEPKTTVCPFTDVSKDAYFYDAVLWAVENGITKGVTETTFEPYTTCSRAHMVTFICRFAGGEPVGDSNNFVDVPENVYYTDPVQWAVETGVTNGTTATTFSPNNPCTRGQMVTFLYRHFEK